MTITKNCQHQYFNKNYEDIITILILLITERIFFFFFIVHRMHIKTKYFTRSDDVSSVLKKLYEIC